MGARKVDFLKYVFGDCVSFPSLSADLNKRSKSVALLLQHTFPPALGLLILLPAGPNSGYG